MGYHPNRMHRGTPLNPAKTQRISWHWPVFRHLPADNQRKTKRVESCLVRCLDGGSSPPISTGKTDNQSLIKNKHDSERTVWGCVYFIISVCPELRGGTGVSSRFYFSEIHLHLRVRERALNGGNTFPFLPTISSILLRQSCHSPQKSHPSN